MAKQTRGRKKDSISNPRTAAKVRAKRHGGTILYHYLNKHQREGIQEQLTLCNTSIQQFANKVGINVNQANLMLSPNMHNNPRALTTYDLTLLYKEIGEFKEQNYLHDMIKLDPYRSSCLEYITIQTKLGLFSRGYKEAYEWKTLYNRTIDRLNAKFNDQIKSNKETTITSVCQLIDPETQIALVSVPIPSLFNSLDVNMEQRMKHVNYRYERCSTKKEKADILDRLEQIIQHQPSSSQT